MNKTTRFKQLLDSDGLVFLMEAHNGLSAKIVEEAGFPGIWASGLAISAALGVRDNNEASWTQVLEAVEFMCDATEIPILLDGDTGYGNFNNIRRLVRKLEQRGVAAVCIEDKLFPKTNSFIQGERQPLADMDEFVGKIRAVKDAQTDPDFCMVARLEGFIAGWGLTEVLDRAKAYQQAGADALLVHSKKRSPEEVLAFAAAWDGSCPLVIVPTSYYGTPAETFGQAGIRMVIWANHNMRSCITAMQRTCRQILEEQSVRTVEDQIAPMKEVFRLQNAEELLAAEERYLPRRVESIRAIVLAASRGGELGELTRSKPKAMIPIGGVPLLHKLVDQFRSVRIKDIIVVRGYGKLEVRAPGVHFVDNDNFEATAEVVSLTKAIADLEGELVISFGDILFRKYILHNLLLEGHDLVVVVDAAWQSRGQGKGYIDYVTTSRPYSLAFSEDPVFLVDIGPNLAPERIHGEWIGLVKSSARGSALIRGALQKLAERPEFHRLRFDDLFRYLLGTGVSIQVLYITGHWLDVDDLDDLTRAQAF